MEDEKLCHEEEIQERKAKEIKNVNVQFSIFIVGFTFLIGPFMAVLNLQSSINIEENVGTSSLGIGYMASFLFLIFCVPTLTRRYGSKAVLITGEASYLFYIAANFYPVAPLMILAGILLGMGEAAVWSNAPLFNTYFGKCQGRFGTKIKSSYIRKFNGLFFGVVQIGQVFGNLCSYVILYGMKSKTVETDDPDKNASLILEKNWTIFEYNESDYFQYCGANDCQNPNVTIVEKDRYMPDRVSVYILMGVFCILCFCGIALQILFLPEPTTAGAKEKKSKSETNILTDTASTLLETWKQAIDVKQLLLAPYSFYFGMYVGFVFGELSRAYTSCILGVEQVGLAAITYGICTGVLSTLSRKIIGYFGRNKIFSVIFGIDITNYIFCLVWRPAMETMWLVYLIFLFFGLTDGLWKTSVLSVYNDYWVLKNLDIALVIYNLWMSIGMAVQFFWSPLMCVSSKIWIQIVLLVFSAICYGATEFIHHSQVKKNTSSKNQSLGNVSVPLNN